MRLKNAVLATHALKINYLLAGRDQGGLKEILKIVKKENILEFKYLGEISDSDRTVLLKNSMGFLLPSYLEGIPFSIYEALSLGKPAILTKISYVPSLKNLIFCDPSLESIKNSITLLLEQHNHTAEEKKDLKIKSDDEIFSNFYEIVLDSLKK